MGRHAINCSGKAPGAIRAGAIWPGANRAAANLRLMAVLLCLACLAFSVLPAHAASSRSSFNSPKPFSLPPGELSSDAELTREAEGAVRRAERSLSLQTDIPEGGKTIQKENVPLEITPPSARFSQGMAQAILYGGIAVIIIIVLMSLKDNLWSSSRSRRLEHEEEEAVPAAAAVRMEKAQAEADDLASCGSFAEAMHTLLLQSVNELRRKLDISIAASLTSREILYRVSLPAVGKTAFAEVIGWVEISYFGFHEPSRDDYIACRGSYETLTAVLRQGSPRSREKSA